MVEFKQNISQNILRDNHGIWIIRLLMKQSLVCGLNLAWERRMTRITLETDSREAYDLLIELNFGNHHLRPSILEGKELLSKTWDITLHWIGFQGKLMLR